MIQMCHAQSCQLTNSNGCDSIAVLNLTINQSDTSYTNITACDSAVWNGTTYTQSGTYSYCGSSSSASNNYSMSFDGVDDYIPLNYIDLSTDFTIFLNFKANYTSGDYWQPIISNIWNTYGFLLYQYYNPSDGLTYLKCWNGSSATFLSNLSLNTFYSLTLKYSNGYLSAYLDGTLVYAGSMNILYSPAPNFLIGARYDPNGSIHPADYFTGNLDNFSYWNTPLSMQEIQDYMNCPPIGTEAGLVGYWNFEEGPGSTDVLDQTSNGNNGTINGATYDTNVPSQSCSLTNANGCDSIAILNLTINQSDTSYTNITNCDSYTWSVNGTTYTQTGTYTDVSTNSSGCTETEILVLTINNSTTNTNYLPSNGLVGWWPFNGNANDESGNAYNGTVNGAALTTDRLGATNSAYSFNGNSAFIQTPTSAVNFPSGFTISVWAKVLGANTNTNCSFGCAEFLVTKGDDGQSGRISIQYSQDTGGETFAGATDYSLSVSSLTQYPFPQPNWHHVVYTFDNTNYKIYLDGLLMNTIASTTAIPNLASDIVFGKMPNNTSYPYYFNGYLDDIGIWNHALTPGEITNLYSAVNFASPTGTHTITECDAYTWIDGNTYTTSNNTATFTIFGGASSGCDSIVNLDLTILNSSTGTDTRTECDSYTWSVNGTTYTQSGTYTAVSTNSSGCTDTEILVLTINNSTTNTTTITDCDSYTWSVNGTTYTQSGTYTAVSTNSSGCTDTEILVLTINNSTTNTTTITDCDSYTWSVNGTTYTQSGTYTAVSTNSSGCTDTEILVLTINNSTTNTTTITDCDSYTWSVNGTTYTQSGTYTDVSTNSSGCTDTEILVLTINNSTTNTTTITDCDSYTWSVNGTTYTQSGTYTDVSTNSSGCTDTEILVLTINNSTTNTTTITDCDSYTWSVNGTTYTQSGTYTDVSTNSSGCTDTEILVLTINNSTTNTTTITDCDSYTWSVNGTTYTQSGTYTDVSTNSSGCTDTEILVLTINNSTTNTTTITDCDSYTWSVNGTTYTQSGTYTDVSTNSSGCTDTEILVLTINNSTTNTTTITDCDSYTWSVNGTTYTQSGTYTDVSTNSSGCTDTEILVLTINNSTTNTTTITDCDSYTWSVNGTTYTQSGTYTDVSTNSSGCTDTEILVLTINNSTTNTTTITDCDSYTWSVNGTTYTQSGTYTDVSTNSSGCTDTEILVLIINNSISLTNTVSICFGDSITLGSNTYSQTGIYTDVFTAVNGCDSIITTNLNVSQQIITIISQLGMDINVNPTGGNMPYVYEWNTGETSQTIIPNQDGDYWVIVTDANGCLSDTSFFVVDWIHTSVEDFNIDRLSIYPNPSRDIFNIEFTSLLRQNLEIRIINSIGEIIYLENLENYTGEYSKAINLKEYSKALYFLEITTNNGVVNKKLILQ